ncbi:Uncharacterised protein [uncultured archaeon]|nr:Uncharacterised protein [uncultured archaeon]
MGEEIILWLEKLKEYWLNKDINKIIGLFDKSVSYYESSSLKIPYENLSNEWEVINGQNNIFLEFDVFVSHKQKHAVIWKLEYLNNLGKKESYSGTYLIELNDENLCTYFLQVCEE